MKLSYQSIGKGQAIVILHGLYGMSDNWLSIAKKLEQNFQIFLVDLRNHGKSPMSPFHSYECMSEDLLTFFEDKNLSSAYLLGHSMGGKVAMNFAAHFPEKIKKLVIVDISPKTYPLENKNRELTQHKKICETLLSIPLKDIKTRQEAFLLMEKGIKSAQVRSFLLKNLYRKEDGKFEWRINLPILYACLPKIMSGFEHLATNFKSFPFEVLFIKGALSNYIQNDDIQWINENFNKVKIENIANASHWVHSDQSELFFKILKDFLEE